MSTTIEAIDPRTAPEATLRRLHEHYVHHDAELLPDDPPEPYEQRVADWRNLPDHVDVRRWALSDGDGILAVAVVYMNRFEDLNNGFARIHVRVDRRREGHATQLAAPVLEFLEDNERKSLITDVPADAPYEPWLEDLGLKKSLEDKRSRLVLDDVDWGLMDSWIHRAAERASGYELLALSTPIPEEHLEAFCEVLHVMNTAPKEDLDFEDFVMTPKKWRDIEAKKAASKTEGRFLIAVAPETGRFAGLTEIILPHWQRDLAWQGDTGVDPAHRNLGLGRWLKAEMLKRLVEERPEVTRIDTYNAGSNEPMLNINLEMGFRPILIQHAWQGPTASVRERLGL